MILLPAEKSRSIGPAVTVRAPNGRQRCIAFNSALAEKMLQKPVTHVAIDIDEKARTMTFIPVADEFYLGEPAHRLVSDGGGNSIGKCVYLQTTQLPESMIETKRYKATVKAKKFSFEY